MDGVHRDISHSDQVIAAVPTVIRMRGSVWFDILPTSTIATMVPRPRGPSNRPVSVTEWPESVCR